MGIYNVFFDRLELTEQEFSSLMYTINKDYILPFKDSAPLMPLYERMLYYMGYQVNLQRSGKRQELIMTGHPVIIIFRSCYYLSFFYLLFSLYITYFFHPPSSYILHASLMTYIITSYLNDSFGFLAILIYYLVYGLDLEHVIYILTCYLRILIIIMQ